MEFAWEARSSAGVQETRQSLNGQEKRPSGVNDLPSDGEDEEDEEDEEEEEEEEEEDEEEEEKEEEEDEEGENEVWCVEEGEECVVQALARCVGAVDWRSGTQCLWP